MDFSCKCAPGLEVITTTKCGKGKESDHNPQSDKPRISFGVDRILASDKKERSDVSVSQFMHNQVHFYHQTFPFLDTPAQGLNLITNGGVCKQLIRPQAIRMAEGRGNSNKIQRS